ncbi:MAG: four helix bundle protein [Vicingus serpentipes]|nr:four helix bundle protein [Vicingus serpentipes]
MGTFKSFEEIQAWQKSKAIALDIYKITNDKSFKNDFDLYRQMRRCTISISSNIAEGFERQTIKEFVQFLFIAKGSCGELRSQLHIAFELKYIEDKIKNQLLEDCDFTSKMINKLITYLRTTIKK